MPCQNAYLCTTYGLMMLHIQFKERICAFKVVVVLWPRTFTTKDSVLILHFNSNARQKMWIKCVKNKMLNSTQRLKWSSHSTIWNGPNNILLGTWICLGICQSRLWLLCKAWWWGLIILHIKVTKNIEIHHLVTVSIQIIYFDNLDGC